MCHCPDRGPTHRHPDAMASRSSPGSHDASINSAETKTGEGAGVKRTSFMRRHKAVTVLLVLLSVLAAVAVGGIVFLNSKLGQIDHVQITLPEAERPEKPASSGGGEPLNILLAGTDNRGDLSIADAVSSENWVPGAHRSDTIMILHISADRQRAYVISIPRDSYVPLYDQQGQYVGRHKINAAFSLYGPSAFISTVENLTDLRMDHLAIVDWDGFRNLTDALGGVVIYIPETVYDDGQVTWQRGYQFMDGELALRYVQTRYGLAEGDFDRIRRQQNFLRVLMSKLLSEGTLTNPFKLSRVLDAVTKNLTVDSEWRSSDLRSLALSLRGLRTSDVTFLSAPRAENWNQLVDGEGSVVVLDKQSGSRLWNALAEDDVASYVADHQDDLLPGSESVR